MDWLMHAVEGTRRKPFVIVLNQDTAELSVIPYGHSGCDFP